MDSESKRKRHTKEISQKNAATVPLPPPNIPVSVSADGISSGLPIPAIARIKIFSDREWEDFILEWAHSLRNTYARVERCAGAGDMGRDIVATHKDSNSLWDNYQCKHYRDPLAPSDVWIELGKLAYYTYRGDYTYPHRYYFVAPCGVGTKLSNLLKKPDKLRAELIANWDKSCRTKISTTTAVELNNGLLTYLNSLDFSIFEGIPPLILIDGHKTTCWHVNRFGGGLPARPPIANPPSSPMDFETNYLRELLNAYGDHLKRRISSIIELKTEDYLNEHFRDSRTEFYSSESLRTFSRDTLPPGEFEKLQDEIYSGICDDVRADYEDGYKRVLAVVKTSKILSLTAHPLLSRVTLRDRGGICHQLANDGKVKWVK